MKRYEEILEVDNFEQMRDELFDLVRALRDKIIERIKADGKDPLDYLFTVRDDHLSGRIRMDAVLYDRAR